MSVGMFMAILDIQVVAAALPRIATTLHMPLDALSWVQTAYLITEVIAIALSGRLARALSTRWLFTIATLGFVLTSLGCALSHDFVTLIVWRTAQGFFAGTIIPTVFAAGYKMFPKSLHAKAILIAGAVAMLAPSIGPLIGGYIAQKVAWNWLFVINIPIGIVVATVVARVVDVDRPDRSAWRTIDAVAFVGLAAGLAALQILMKLAPPDHWTAPRDFGLAALTMAGFVLFVLRCRSAADPLVDLSPLRDGGFTAACGFNFVLGIAFFGSLYLLPLFLGFVRFHTPLEIGITMTVMGAAQLIVAPLATFADRRLPAQLVVAIGFGLFALGSLANAFETPRSDFAELLLPQILRGAALLFCILPITNVALDDMPAHELSNASGLLNFMRNIGGAIGIGIVDTIVNVRPPAIAAHLLDQLTAGVATTAAFVGLPRDLLQGVSIAHADPDDIAFATPIIARAAATLAFNEAWIVIAVLLAISTIALSPLLRRSPAAQALLESPTQGLAADVQPASV